MGTWFVNFAELLDERGSLKTSLEGAELDRAALATLIVEAVTSRNGDDDGYIAAAARCRRSRAGCSGRLHVKRGQDAAIVWRCPQCSDGGVITGFEGTRWDLTDVAALAAPSINVGVDLETLDCVVELELAPGLRAAIVSASYEGVEAHLRVPAGLLLRLADAIGRAAFRASARGQGRRALEGLASRLRGRGRMLEEQPAASRASAGARAAAALSAPLAAVEPLSAVAVVAESQPRIVPPSPQRPPPHTVLPALIVEPRPSEVEPTAAMATYNSDAQPDYAQASVAAVIASDPPAPAIANGSEFDVELVEPARDGPITEQVLRGRRGITAATIENLVHFQPATVVEALDIYGVGRRVTALLLELGLITDPDGAQNATA